MSKDLIRDILYTFLGLIILIIGIKFIIWILPVVMLLIIGYTIYKYIKIKRGIKNVNNYQNSMRKDKNKKIKVIHEFDED